MNKEMSCGLIPSSIVQRPLVPNAAIVALMVMLFVGANLLASAAAAEVLTLEARGNFLTQSSYSGYRDPKGLKNDTWSILGYQAAAIAVLYTMPEDVSKWSAEQKDNLGLSVWWDNASNPVWDKDPHVINYVLHPYWGASYFVRARERGYSNTESFFYTALLSSAYEFGAESLVEKASIQDLVVTPVAGALLGGFFMRIRHSIQERELATGTRRMRDSWLLAFTDPIGSANKELSKLFGPDSMVTIRPYNDRSTTAFSLPTSNGTTDPRPVYGLQLQIEW